MSNFGRQIEAFRAVMLTGGMTPAAETLRITQPAVSRLVQDLERDLKIRLFHRKGNQITPTVEATAFLAEIERAYLGMEQLRAYAADLRQSLTGSLRIAALPAMALGFLPHCLAAFSRTRPKLSIHLDGIPSHLVLERVAGGQFELGFAAVAADRPMVDLTPIRTRAMVVLPAGHRLAEYDVLTADQLTDERIVMLDRANYLRHTIERALGGRERYPSTIETPLSAIACSLVAKGLGVTIVDSFTAISFVGHGVEARPLVPELDFGFSMVTARQRPMSQVAQEFAEEVQLLAEEFQALIFG